MRDGGGVAVKDFVSVVAELRTVDLTNGAGGVAYVVQVAGTGDDVLVWTDIVRVVAPGRSKRQTIIRVAIESGVSLPVTVRVLDATAAHEHRVTALAREPQLVIS